MKISVLGAGSWGTTLALVLNQNTHQVTCWSFDKNDIDNIVNERENLATLLRLKYEEVRFRLS